MGAAAACGAVTVVEAEAEVEAEVEADVEAEVEAAGCGAATWLSVDAVTSWVGALTASCPAADSCAVTVSWVGATTASCAMTVS